MNFEASLRMLFHLTVTTSIQAAVIARMRGASLEEAVEVGMGTYADLHESGNILPLGDDLEQLELLLRKEIQDTPVLTAPDPSRSLH